MPDFVKKSGVQSSIPTGSMADIAFLLLIFFMVTTVFVRYRIPGIVLPKAEKVEEIKMPFIGKIVACLTLTNVTPPFFIVPLWGGVGEGGYWSE